MERIICDKCKNAYLQKNDDGLYCPSCNAAFPAESENLFLGIQYYKEEEYEKANDRLMKAIVADSTDFRALFYKGLCDGFLFDEDTLTLNETYEKIITAFSDIPAEEYVHYLSLSDSECEKLERAFTEYHVRMFETADAEAIKKEVAAILGIRENARKFRTALTELADRYNETAEKKISVRFSKCFYVEAETADEVGDLKFNKIKEDIASHTVFTGILSNDIKNLEIYYRCIVMFFEKSKAKYDFLLKNATKFNSITKFLSTGNYKITGTDSTADKLKATAYDFFEESLKEHDDDELAEVQTQNVVELEPEVVEIEEVDEKNDDFIDISSESSSETAENIVEITAEENAQAESADGSDEVTDEALNVEFFETSEDSSASAASAVPEDMEFEDISSSSFGSENDENSADVSEQADDAENDDDVIIAEEPVVSEEVSAEDEAEAEEKEPEADDADEAEADEAAEVEEESDTSEGDGSEKADVVGEDIKSLAQMKKETGERFAPASSAVTVESSQNSASEANSPQRKKKRHIGRKAFILILVVAAGLAAWKYLPGHFSKMKYDNACSLEEANKYEEAAAAFAELGDYMDSADRVMSNKYNTAKTFEEKEDFAGAAAIYSELGDYMDSPTKARSCSYSEAVSLLENSKFDEAKVKFEELADYGDSKKMLKECDYRKAVTLIEAQKYEEAIALLEPLKKYNDSQDKIKEAKYLYVTENRDKKNPTTVKFLKQLVKAEFRNSKALQDEIIKGIKPDESTEVEKPVSKKGKKAPVIVTNNSQTDVKNSSSEIDRTKYAYFHVVNNSSAYKNKKVTLSYKTDYGYKESKSFVLSDGAVDNFIKYPPTPQSGYKVVLTLTDENGKTLDTATITIK